MKQTVQLMPAPTVTQPGGYVPVAYADRNRPATAQAQIEATRTGDAWTITLRWDCPAPVRDISKETDTFLDACALIAPSVAGAPWMTMGEPGKAVEGLLWRPDRDTAWKVRAEGLGSMERLAAPAGWKARGAWDKGRWEVVFEVAGWPALAEHKQLAFAIWRGAASDRGGLKSVSPGWLSVG